MELAIPFVALSSMYVISNQSKEKEKDTFVNMGKPSNLLPNVNERVENYPTLNKEEFNNTVQKFPSNIESTNSYLNQNIFYEKEKDGVRVGPNIQDVYSFKGDGGKSNDFVHNNMVSINGKTREQIYKVNNTSTILDTYNGKGSQYQKKTEQAPLFKPEADIQWSHGTPNMSNFIQSRVNPSMKNNMVRPFDTVKVGGGGDESAVSDGLGGFNSGMNERNKWMPKTVDELRSKANPKEEYMLLNHEGPANSYIKNRGIQGEVKKNRPDTFYENTPNKWFTTTGVESAGPAPITNIVKDSHRNDCSVPVVGHAFSQQQSANTAPETFTEPKRLPTDTSHYVSPSYAGDHAPVSNKSHESYLKYVNNRQINNQPDNFGTIFSKSIGAVMAPVMDILKPCKKEEHVCNARVFGNMGIGEISAGYTQSPNELKLTTKETTLYSSNGFIGNQGDGGYKVSKPFVGQTQRDANGGECGYLGGVGGAATSRGNTQYDSMYRHAIDDKKETSVKSRTPSGNTQVFNPTQNMYVTRADVSTPSTLPPRIPVARGPTTETHGQIRDVQEYDQSFQDNRINPNLITALKSNPFTHIVS